MIFGQILEIPIIVFSDHIWSDFFHCILGYNLDQLSNHQIPCFKKIVCQGILPVLIWKWIQKGNLMEVRCFILERPVARSRKTSTKHVSDPLAAFQKMSISSTESSRKFCLTSILTSDNNSTWLTTRKNDNDLAKSAANKSDQNQSDQDLYAV